MGNSQNGRRASPLAGTQLLKLWALFEKRCDGPRRANSGNPENTNSIDFSHFFDSFPGRFDCFLIVFDCFGVSLGQF